MIDSGKTARQIVVVSRLFASERSFFEPLIFADRTPYSALFYGRGWVVPHPKESLVTSLGRFEGKAESVLAAVNVAHKKDGEPLPPGGWTELATVGRWRLLRVRVPVSGARLGSGCRTSLAARGRTRLNRASPIGAGNWPN